jgi:hypothetical protein
MVVVSGWVIWLMVLGPFCLANRGGR